MSTEGAVEEGEERRVDDRKAIEQNQKEGKEDDGDDQGEDHNDKTGASAKRNVGDQS